MKMFNKLFFMFVLISNIINFRAFHFVFVELGRNPGVTGRLWKT